jgi:hypothetical protein
MKKKRVPTGFQRLWRNSWIGSLKSLEKILAIAVKCAY